MEKGIFNSKSSISRCDPYSNPYDLQKQAEAAAVALRKKRYAGQADGRMDKSGLEGQILQRIRKRGVEVFGKKARIFAVIIKHLFFGITLPFYFLFYILPAKTGRILERWIGYFSKILAKICRKVGFFLKRAFSPVFCFFQKQTRRIEVGLLWVKTAFSYGISAIKERGRRWLKTRP